jgi:hypothetical protein
MRESFPLLQLWPEIVARVPIPEDVEQALIVPLRDLTLSSSGTALGIAG